MVAMREIPQISEEIGTARASNSREKLPIIAHSMKFLYFRQPQQKFRKTSELYVIRTCNNRDKLPIIEDSMKLIQFPRYGSYQRNLTNIRRNQNYTGFQQQGKAANNSLFYEIPLFQAAAIEIPQNKRTTCDLYFQQQG